jgi:acyl-CoA thioesterase-1
VRPVQANLRCFALFGWLVLSATASAATKDETRILVLGDSISAAYGMSLAQGWVALLEERLAPAYPGITLINASISGETTIGGLARLPALLEQHKPDILLIELGGNDGLRGYPVPRLRDNLTQMVQLGRDAGARVMVLPMEIPPNYGSRYTGAFRDSFARVAEEAGATLGPFILDGIAIDATRMQGDGIHPTPEAQPAMAALMEPALRAVLDSL